MIVKHAFLCFLFVFFYQKPSSNTCISPLFKTLGSLPPPPSLDVSTHPRATYPAAPPGRSMHLSPSLLLPTTPSFASSPVLLPHGEFSHSTRPGRRRSPPADKAVAAEGAASPPPLHMFAEIGSSAYQRGTFTFFPLPALPLW